MLSGAVEPENWPLSGAEDAVGAPVLCVAFNRPDLFERLIAAVRDGGKRKLLVAIDGPRPGHPEDKELCLQVRQTAEAIDWAAGVELKAEATNQGMPRGVSSAISWALDRTPEVIVLEDDCLPDPTFFRFCDELLPRYRDDERVMQIAATNWGAAPDRFRGHSYAFTAYAPVWGWATWRRAWDLYDFDLDSWPRFKGSGLVRGMSIGRRFRRVLSRDWDTIRQTRDSWDYQWQYAVLRHHGLSVCPARNLVTNVGFRDDATQLSRPDRIFSQLPTERMDFPLVHPPEVARNADVDAVFERIYWLKRGAPARAYSRLVRNPRFDRAIRRAARSFLPRPS